MHVESQRPLVRWFRNMHGRHPGQAKGPSVVFSCVIQYLLGDHACIGVTPSPWHTEMAFAVAVGHLDVVSLMEYLLI